MTSYGIPFHRRKEVLELFLKHGPLSLNGLEALLSKKTTRRSLEICIRGLRLAGHLISRSDTGQSHNSRNFYEITPFKHKRDEISKLLDKDVSTYYRAIVRKEQLKHSEDCALWMNRFSHLFPKATILNEYQLAKNPIAARKLLSGAADLELRPDLLILEPRANGNGYVGVAVEVEYHLKSETRVVQKLKRFANKTLLDGVLYVSQMSAILEKVRLIYESKVLQRAMRINQYGRNFYLFTEENVSTQNTEPKTYNSSLETISLSKWLRHLSQTETLLRRDSTIGKLSEPR